MCSGVRRSIVPTTAAPAPIMFPVANGSVYWLPRLGLLGVRTLLTHRMLLAKTWMPRHSQQPQGIDIWRDRVKVIRGARGGNNSLHADRQRELEAVDADTPIDAEIIDDQPDGQSPQIRPRGAAGG